MSHSTSELLTVFLPTRNRPALCAAHLRFLRACGLQHAIVVADSSDHEDPRLKAACTGSVEYRRFDPAAPPEDKFVAVAKSISTPFVAMITDDDISFPHAIEAGLAFLREHADYSVAQGYVLRFGRSWGDFIIRDVQWFIPGIAEVTPVRRLYELMRRYQPFFWAVFRTDAFVEALEAAKAATGAIFQEMAFTATIALLGKAARLPMIQTLRGEEESHTPLSEGHPFHWFLRDAPSFFSGYVGYRNDLVAKLARLDSVRQSSALEALLGKFTREGRAKPGFAAPPGANDYAHTVDIIHATYFGREVELGMINHTARFLVGDAIAPLKPDGQSRPDIVADDLVHGSKVAGRRYVWRNAVLTAEPRAEITIDAEEIARVEAALDNYRLD
jgi:glycosyltransferase domain-containing protein